MKNLSNPALGKKVTNHVFYRVLVTGQAPSYSLGTILNSCFNSFAFVLKH